MWIRNSLYQLGVFKEKNVSATVVSIGNVTVGGTGKTPLTLFLARELIRKNKRVAILSRGYRSEAEKGRLPLLACIGKGPLFSWKKIGDEPFLLAKRLPEVSLFVGRNRVESASLASKEHPILLLDDGLQYRKLKRDVEIVTVDGHRSLEREQYLPCGYLRDTPHRLKKADLVVVRLLEEKEIPRLEKDLRKYTSAPFVAMKAFFSIKTLEGKEIPSLQGMSIGAFCALARPQQFLSTLVSLGADVQEVFLTADHEEISLQTFSSRCRQKGISHLVCTEKDAVKLEGKGASLPILFLEMDYQIIHGQKEWEKLVEKMVNKRDNTRSSQQETL